MEIFDKLMAKIKEYHPSNDLSQVEKAFFVAQRAHGDQLRKSGEPYIVHPVSVAYILADLELDLESIIAGILHDVIEDTVFTYNDIVNQFGQEVADIVDGVTKLDEIEVKLKTSITDEGGEKEKPKDKNYLEEIQAENYRKMFLAMAKDIRVVLIKIADRLHNMRTLKYMTPEKQKEKAQETLDIYCPLAHRLGISKLRHELEDLSFRYLNPDAYFDLADKVSRKQSERQAYIQRIVEEIRQKMLQENIDATVDGRPKHFFSIYKKMKSQDKTLDQVYDLFAVRIIVNDVRYCYEALGIVHEMYKPIPGRFKDYIAMPKPNMYQSLHTVVIGPEGEPVEIQMRTWEMHRTSEYGIAAHWRYKEGVSSSGRAGSEEEKMAWLRQILDWQREMSDNQEFMKALKVDLDVFSDQVYCFSPRGDIINLTRGSTPIDFAYAIHSAVGNKMIGARVNNKIVTFGYQLQSGDRVEIITSQNSRGPSRDWLSIVKTGQARNKINQWFKKENKEENTVKGKELLEKEARKKGLVFSELASSNERKAAALNKFGFQDWNALCAAVGHGGVKEGQVVNRLNEDYQREQKRLHPPELDVVTPEEEKEAQARNRKKKSGIYVKGVGDIDVRFSKCCNPVPGDEIVAFTTRGRGVSIHRTDCLNIINLDEMNRQRLLEAEWHLPEKGSEGITYVASMKISCDDRMGILTDISRVLNEEKLPVCGINAKIHDGLAVFDIDIAISNRGQFDRAQKRILQVPDVQDIARVTT